MFHLRMILVFVTLFTYLPELATAISLTSVAFLAVTDDLVGGVVRLTGEPVKVIRAGVTGAGAGPTVFP